MWSVSERLVIGSDSAVRITHDQRDFIAAVEANCGLLSSFYLLLRLQKCHNRAL